MTDAERHHAEPGSARVFRGRTDRPIYVAWLIFVGLWMLGLGIEAASKRPAVIVLPVAVFALFAWATVRQMQAQGVRADELGVVVTNFFWGSTKLPRTDIDHFEVANVGCVLVRRDGRSLRLLSLPPSIAGLHRREAEEIAAALNRLKHESASSR